MFNFHKNNVTAYADHGLYDMISDDLSLSDHVRARKDGLNIKTDSIFWDAGKRSLRSDSHVQIKGDSIVVGNSTPDEKSDVLKELAQFPKELTTFLKNNGICIFVGNAGTKLTELGFGLDLDGDGKITPGKWVDVNQDGQKQMFEVEDQFEDGKKWDQQPAAYNHKNRMIFISARVLKDPKFEKILKHEINHALDLTYQDNPQLKVKWKAYISKLYNAARRQGKIAFDELDPHEYFAISEPF